jgi:hypothetical protein
VSTPDMPKTLYRPPGAPRRSFWTALGTPRAVQIVTVLMIVYAIAIGALVFGYAQVSSCLASYAEAAAKSTAARAKLAADDRTLDEADRQLADQERVARDRSEAALDEALASLVAQPPNADRAKNAFARLVIVRTGAATTRAQTATERAKNAKTRADNEAERAQSPPPPPPSESC